jgi:hypothetical protein
VVLQNLPAGRQELKLYSWGYPSVKRAIVVDDIRGQDIHVTFASPFGGVEVTTIPPGCEIEVDGLVKGKSVKADGGSLIQAAPFAVGGLREGNHLVKASHPNGGSAQQAVVVAAGKTVAVALRLWVMDTRVRLVDGTVKHGMLMSRNEMGDIVLAEPKANRYLKEEVAAVETLTAEEAQALLKARTEQ